MGEQAAAREPFKMLQRTARSHGDVAQLGEHLPCKQGVESSNLFVSIRELSQRKHPGVSTERRKSEGL
jgi:hypothetical protein